ncbi:MAG: MFS transporter [Verrucomicrobia bacterium]|nr:MFS transporter [Verrucomicrobiota bacterium]
MSLWKKWGVLLGTGLSSMLVSIDFTIVNTSLVSIQKSLSASIIDLQWYISAFGIPFCVLLVICGRLADLLGRRLVLYIGMAGFGIASLTAGLSSSSLELIISRFFLGAFGATIFPCGMALTAGVFPKKDHGKALGIYFGLLGVGLAVGPVIGGFITTALGWNWIFFINIPVILISFLICLPSVQESKIATHQKIDWMGMLLIFVGLSGMVTWITEGPLLGWTSPFSMSILAASLVFIWLFFRSERQTKFPMIPLHFFRKPNFIIAGISNIASISCMWAVIFILPLYLQSVLGFDAAKAGMMVLIMTAMTVIAPPFAGYLLDTKGEKRIIFIMFSSLITGYLLLLNFSSSGSFWQLVLGLLFIGFGWGSGNGISGPLVLSGHPTNENAGLLSGSASTVLNIFGVLLVTQTGTLFRFGEHRRLFSLLKDANLTMTPAQEERMFTALAQPERAQEILSEFSTQTASTLASFFKEAFVYGFQLSTAFLLAFTILLFALMQLALKRKKLSGRS